MYNKKGDNYTTNVTLHANMTTFTIQGLDANTTYLFQLTALNPVGMSEPAVLEIMTGKFFFKFIPINLDSVD